ncbi:pfkB-like carbohydrate kinase family protein isoform X2 [Wolffia australiana]
MTARGTHLTCRLWKIKRAAFSKILSESRRKLHCPRARSSSSYVPAQALGEGPFCKPTDSAIGCTVAGAAVSWRHPSFIRSPVKGRLGSALASRMATTVGIEVDATNILKRITPPLDPQLYKGQAGKIAVIGGCREYTGAPYFAAISALKIVTSSFLINIFSPEYECVYSRFLLYVVFMQGADLSHVFCTKDAAAVIKSYSPELIVHPVLEESYSVREDEKVLVSSRVLAEVRKWMERFDCLVVGPGLGRDPFLLDCVSEIIQHARQLNVPIVVDGDGLFLVTNNLDLILGYSLAALTPNVNEYRRLVEKVLEREVDDQNAAGQLSSLSSRLGGVTILRKGKADLISDGRTVCMVSAYGSPRRCGGQGDILSGSVAVFSSWAKQTLSESGEHFDFSSSNPMILGCIAGSALLRKAASLAFADKKRATLTSDIIESLGTSVEVLCQEK